MSPRVWGVLTAVVATAVASVVWLLGSAAFFYAAGGELEDGEQVVDPDNWYPFAVGLMTIVLFAAVVWATRTVTRRVAEQQALRRPTAVPDPPPDDSLV